MGEDVKKYDDEDLLLMFVTGFTTGGVVVGFAAFLIAILAGK